MKNNSDYFTNGLTKYNLGSILYMYDNEQTLKEGCVLW